VTFGKIELEARPSVEKTVVGLLHSPPMNRFRLTSAIGLHELVLGELEEKSDQELRELVKQEIEVLRQIGLDRNIVNSFPG